MKKAMMLAGLLGASVFLDAQDWSYAAKLGFVTAQGDLATLTQRHNGLIGEIGAQTALTEGVDLRFHLGHLVIRRENIDGLAATDPRTNTADAKNTWFGMDLSYEGWNKRMEFYTGPTLNQWDISGRVTGPMGDTNWHMGWRAGLTWRVTRQWGIDAHYGFSEWKSYFPAVGTNVVKNTRTQVNPSWVGIAARYAF